MRRLVIGVWWLASCRWITARAACEVSVKVSGSTYTIVLPDHLPFGTAEAAEVIAQISPGGELSLLSGGCADDTCLAERLVAHARASGCRVAAAVDEDDDAYELAGCDWRSYARRYNLVWKYGRDAAALRRHYLLVGRRDGWFCGGAEEGAAQYRKLQALPFEPLPPARPWRQDPQLGEACAAAHGAMADAPGRVRTFEDAVANRTTVASRPVPGMFLGSPYGALAARRGHSGDSNNSNNHHHHHGGARGEVLYVEIPKAASTFVNRRLSNGGGRRIPNFDVLAHLLAPAAPAVFTVVREPLERFLSGYGEVTHRAAAVLEAQGLPPALLPAAYREANDTARLAAYVDLVIAAGDDFSRFPALDPTFWAWGNWQHTLTQMWFIEQVPRAIDRVLHLETLDADLAALRADLGLVADFAASRPESATATGRSDALRPLLDARPDLEDRLVEVYLKHDYACLGYPDPRRHRRST